MKKIALLLLIGFAIALTSCEPKAPEPAGPYSEFFYKKVDGKIMKGLRNTKKDANNPGKIVIPAKYDDVVKSFENYYMAILDGRKTIYDYDGLQIFNGFLSAELVAKSLYKGYCFDRGRYYRIKTDHGIYALFTDFHNIYGPYKDFVPCFHGFIFEDIKTGKKSYIRVEYRNYKVKGDKNNVILEDFDEIHEINLTEMDPGWIFARRGDREYNIDFEGHFTKRYRPDINRKIASLPLIKEICPNKDLALSRGIRGIQKCGNKNMSVILINPI